MFTKKSASTRSPAVAGMFYPSARETLLAEVDDYLALAEGERVSARVVVSPHAGYMYSGRVAGETFGGVKVPPRVVLLGPKHRRAGESAAVYASGKWQMPFGPVEIDEELVAAVIEEAGLAPDEVAHRDEHSLEVQVPFFWRLNPEVKMVPVVLDFLPLRQLESIGEGIARAIERVARDTLIVASTDMSHQIPAAMARELDFLAIDKIAALDAPGLYETVLGDNISMCGVIPVTTAIYAAKRLGASEARLVRYATSGDVTGDDSHVVGYAGLTIR